MFGASVGPNPHGLSPARQGGALFWFHLTNAASRLVVHGHQSCSPAPMRREYAGPRQQGRGGWLRPGPWTRVVSAWEWGLDING